MTKNFIKILIVLALVGGCISKTMTSMEIAVSKEQGRPLQKVAAVTAGGGHTCVLLLDGTAKCWGHNGIGQLGNETVEEISPTPVVVGGISNVKAFAAGYLHTCAITFDDRVKCFGIDILKEFLTTRNESDIKKMDARTARKLFSRPTEIEGISDARAIGAGRWLHICVVVSDGKVKCWGGNSTGQLGDGTTTNSTSPVVVKGVSNAVAIAAGVAHTCVVLSRGTVKCWGTDSFPGRGKIYGFRSLTPIEIDGISNATSVTAGRNHTCALLSDGTVKCWGSNILGQLGNKGAFTSSTPLKVEGVSNVIAISAGYFYTCALRSDGTAICWGQIAFIGTDKLHVSPPLAVEGIDNAIGITVGGNHICALLQDHTVKCWGGNKTGQLGNGSLSEFSPIPVEVIEAQL